MNPAKSVNAAGVSRENRDRQLDVLLDLFYSTDSMPGNFKNVSVESLTPVAAKLLAHDHHMTVTLEQHHGCSVDVHVLESRIEGNHYARKITLTRQSDKAVVMFGVVRMDRTVFDEAVRDEIESQRTPLGRVLIDHNVLRSVKLSRLYQIQSAGDLVDAFGVDADRVCFGRTAMIYCDGAEAIELLEIVPGE